MKKTANIFQSGFIAGWPVKRMLLVVAVFIVITVGSIVTARAYADTGEQTSLNGRVITLYDRGIEHSFITTATTIGGALKEAGVEVDAHDRVEPALDEELVADEYAVNVYRARPLLIVDGIQRYVIMTAAQVPSQIALDAKLTLYEEDTTSFELSDDIVADKAAERFIVTRATPFEFTLYGETFTARTQAKTVGAMLKEKHITLGENGRVSPGVSAAITAGMKVHVWREGKQTITREEVVDFETEVINDANRPTSFREVRTPGEKGKRNATYSVVIRDGVEVERTEIASVVITPAKKQVEVRGTKPDTIPYTGGGSKDTWLAASNIPRDQWGYAEWLVQKESGWNPNSVNRSSGACGLGQQLPCGKWAGEWNNPVDSLNGMHGYVIGRYGSWEAAVAHSKSVGWY